MTLDRPQCRDEFRDDVVDCPDCRVPLVSELAVLTALVRVETPDELAELIDRLERAGVPYLVQAGTAVRLIEEDEDSLSLPHAWEARLWIRSADAHRARASVQDMLPRVDDPDMLPPGMGDAAPRIDPR